MATLAGLVCLVVTTTASSALAAGDANVGQCSSATEAASGFRTYLPDCRAYELVSPPYKEGFELQALSAVSLDGNHVVAGGIGAFAGSEGTSAPFEPNVYEFSRDPGSGWRPVPLGPPTSSFSGSEFILGGTSADLSRTLWTLHTPAQSVYTHDLYVRDAAGAFAAIGPGFPPSVTSGPTGPEILAPEKNGHSVELVYSGTTPDLSHVLLSIPNEQGFVWPGDTTALGRARSLYEYVGTGSSEPLLVGVRNASHLAGQPHVNEGAELISQCGTTLGSEGSSYNAISASGSRVFFTPQPAREGVSKARCNSSEEGTGPSLNEVYVREAESRTALLSARSPSECTASCASSAARDANFEGASADGSKAFFTSTQQLLNAATQDSSETDSASVGCSETAGAGGCNLYEYDFNAPAGHSLRLVAAGSAVPGVQGVQGVARISSDGSHAYFVSQAKLPGTNAAGEEAVSGKDNMYVFEQDARFPEGHVAFVATLANTDQAVWAHRDHRPAETTPDGRFLLFLSHQHLTQDDHTSETAAQLFEYDAVSGTVRRVSVGQRGRYICPGTGEEEEGFNCNGNVSSAEQEPLFTEEPSYAGADFQASVESRSLLISADGSRVTFVSTDMLTPKAVNSQQEGCANVYEYINEGAAGGNVYLVSGGADLTSFRGLCGARSAIIDPSGSNIFFETGEPLVQRDTDTQRDIYDARTGGGVPEPAPSVTCTGDSCQGALTQATPLPAVASVAPSTGSAVTPAPAPKGSVRTAESRLAKALKVCRRRHGRSRRRCEARARRRYGKASARRRPRRRR